MKPRPNIFGRDKAGRFKKGKSANPLGRKLWDDRNKTVEEHLCKMFSPYRLARAILARAYSGDLAAVGIVRAAVAAGPLESAYDTSKLNETELRQLLALLQKSKRTTQPESAAQPAPAPAPITPENPEDEPDPNEDEKQTEPAPIAAAPPDKAHPAERRIGKYLESDLDKAQPTGTRRPSTLGDVN